MSLKTKWAQNVTKGKSRTHLVVVNEMINTVTHTNARPLNSQKQTNDIYMHVQFNNNTPTSFVRAC